MLQFTSLAEYAGLGELLMGEPILSSSGARFPSVGF